MLRPFETGSSNAEERPDRVDDDRAEAASISSILGQPRRDVPVTIVIDRFRAEAIATRTIRRDNVPMDVRGAVARDGTVPRLAAPTPSRPPGAADAVSRRLFPRRTPRATDGRTGLRAGRRRGRPKRCTAGPRRRLGESITNKINVPDLVVRPDPGGPDKVYRLFTDHLGSPIYVVNIADAQDVLLDAEYDEWGNVVTYSSSTGTWPLPFGFAGGLYDVDTGLVRFGARDYDPSVGRWTAKDPIRWQGGQANLYVYVSNSPTTWKDPSGLFNPALALAGGLAGALTAGALAAVGPNGTVGGALVAAGVGFLGGAAGGISGNLGVALGAAIGAGAAAAQGGGFGSILVAGAAGAAGGALGAEVGGATGAIIGAFVGEQAAWALGLGAAAAEGRLGGTPSGIDPVRVPAPGANMCSAP